MKRIVIWLLILTSFGISSCGGKSLNIQDAWTRAGTQGGNGAIYFVIENPTGQDDVLLNATSEVAEMVELHRSSMDANGVMTMQHQESVAIPAGEEVSFEPGGLHVMLMGLTRDLTVGDRITVTLQFQNAGEISLEVEVQEH